jgi:hypothetical protein
MLLGVMVMGRLKKYAKKSKEEYHQYPWKVDYELFALFGKYCESLNLSVNEALSLLVSDEIESYREQLSEEERTGILDEFRMKKGMFLREGLPPACLHPAMTPEGAHQRGAAPGPQDGKTRRGGPRGLPPHGPIPDNE